MRKFAFSSPVEMLCSALFWGLEGQVLSNPFVGDSTLDTILIPLPEVLTRLWASRICG